MSAYVLRISPSGIDRVPEALEDDEIIIGWSDAEGLLDPALQWGEFRQILTERYYAGENSLRRAGRAGGEMWRFIRDMRPGDLVVVPHGPSFYVAEISGGAYHRPDKQPEDTAYRRPVTWLNNKEPIPRTYARSALISRMKIRGTSAFAGDLAESIREAVEGFQSGQEPDFAEELRAQLVVTALKELRQGRIESFGFEHLIKDLLIKLGASDAWVVGRSVDKGADVLATFRFLDAFQMVVAVQAKHWRPDPPLTGSEVQQLIGGMEAEDADLGLVITTGTFSDDATETAEAFGNESGKRIELVDGEQFAKMLIEHGVGQQ